MAAILCDPVSYVAVLALSLTLSASPVSSQDARLNGTIHKTPIKSHKAVKIVRLDVSKINDPNTREAVGPGSRGDAVVRAEILLDRLKFSPGEIGVSFTKNVEGAIKEFQAANELKPSGTIDSSTWAALNDKERQNQTNPSSAPPQQTAIPQSLQAIDIYIVTPEDVAGPFTKPPIVRGRDAGERLMLREAKLKQLNFASPLDLIAEKFHCSPRLLVELNREKIFSKAGARLQVPNIDAPAPAEVASLVVNASSGRLDALDANGKVVASYPATVGSAHDPLPIGTWKIMEVSWYPHFKYNPNLFWDADDKNARATLAPGPRNPVGVVWMGLSKEHYGIHGTPAPSQIGVTQSHGCIRLTNWDAMELGKAVHIDTPVVLEMSGS